MKIKDNIRLLVLTPQSTLFEGNVEMVELPGNKGRFMVLHLFGMVVVLLS